MQKVNYNFIKYRNYNYVSSFHVSLWRFYGNFFCPKAVSSAFSCFNYPPTLITSS